MLERWDRGEPVVRADLDGARPRRPHRPWTRRAYPEYDITTVTAIDAQRREYEDPPAPYRDYEVIEHLEDAGSIRGVVTWPRAPIPAATLPTLSCGPAANHTLVVDADHRVANAIVYLVDIERGRAGTTRPSGAVAVRKDCRLRPHVTVSAPIGSELALVNADRDPVAVAWHAWSDGARTPAGHTTSLPDRAARVHVPMVEPGIFEARITAPSASPNAPTADPAAPFERGWVVVLPHPYYDITGDDGRFRLANVPPGTYRLEVWHEPVVTSVTPEGAVIFSRPAIARRTVRVRPRARAHISITLP